MIQLSPMHFRKRTSFSSAARLLRVRSSLSSLRFLLPPHRLPSQKADYNFPAEDSSSHSLLSLCCCCCCCSSSSSRWWIGYAVVLRLFYLHRQLCLDLLEGSVVVLLEYALENVELWTLSCMASHEDMR